MNPGDDSLHVATLGTGVGLTGVAAAGVVMGTASIAADILGGFKARLAGRRERFEAAESARMDAQAPAPSPRMPSV